MIKAVERRLMVSIGLLPSDMEVEIPNTILLIDRILERLDSPPLTKMKTLCGGDAQDDDEIKRLKRKLISIQNFVHKETSFEKVVTHDLSGTLHQLIILMNVVKETLYDALDIVDDIATSCCSLSNPMEKTTFLNERLDRLIAQDIRKPMQLELEDPNPLNISDDLSSVFGRQKDEKCVIELLFSELKLTTGEKDIESKWGLKKLSGCCTATISIIPVPVIPILAEAGLGKTTLAKLIYNNPKVQNQFDLKMLVCIPVFYDRKTLMETLVASATGESPSPSITLDVLQLMLKKAMCGKKVLLVLDDVFHEVSHDWDVLLIPFKATSRGSRVLITTRSPIVCSTMGTVLPYHLQPLPYEDCWSLFAHVAFGDNIPPEQVQLCQKILQLVQGFPSVLVGLGGLLKSKTDRGKFHMMQRLLELDSRSIYGGIVSTPLWSYLGMSESLKQCFAYCAVFPEGYGFEKTKLILMWMAQGFLQSSGQIRMEEVGAAYFNQLEEINLFKYRRKGGCFDESIYILTKDAYKLAKNISIDVCNSEGSGVMSKNVRYASRTKFDLTLLKAFYPYGGLQTLLLRSRHGARIEKLSLPYFARSTGSKVPCDFFLKLVCLRVLDLRYSCLTNLPDSIGYLKHLRYLDISENSIRQLPESMSMLYNLLTLDVRNNYKELQFPGEMKKLVNLRHLYFGNGVEPSSMPPGIGKLSGLQTLSSFTVGMEVESGNICELKNLLHLRGSLVILKLENVLNVEDAVRAKMVDKQYLDRLEFYWSYMSDVEMAYGTLAGLQPHENLKHLIIQFYGGLIFPSWVGYPSFYNLQTICICYCNRCESLPPLGQLPLLKSLKIHDMEALEYIDRGFYGNNTVKLFSLFGIKEVKQGKSFPSLETLELLRLSCLKKWTDLERGDMPRLRQLKIRYCPNLISLPNLRFLEVLQDLKIDGCPKLQSLPKEGTPKSLQSLRISSRPLFAKRCKANEGADWKKITRLSILRFF